MFLCLIRSAIPCDKDGDTSGARQRGRHCATRTDIRAVLDRKGDNV